MKKLDTFVLRNIQETSRQYGFLTSQLELILPTELLHRFSVCNISSTEIKICVKSSADHSLIRFYLKNIKNKCAEIYNKRNIKIKFYVTPDATKIKKIEPTKRILSSKSKKLLASYAKNEQDKSLKAILLKLAK